jgi:HK97 family phage prohead protease
MDTRELHTTARLVTRENDPAGDTVEVRAVPFDETLNMLGFRERFAPDVTLTPRSGHPLPMLWRHEDLIGSWDTTLDVRADGIYATGRVSDTALGRDVRTLLADRALAGASVGFVPTEQRTENDPDGNPVTVVTAAELLEISLTPIPAYTRATVTALRERTPTMETTEAPPVEEQRAQASAEDLAALRRDLEQIQARALAAPVAERHWSHDFGSLYDYHVRLYRGEVEQRALDTGLTGDNAGLVKAQWLQRVERIIDLGRPGITAMGRAPLPESGMSFSWPTFTSATGEVAAQGTQNTEVASVATDFGAATPVNIATYAGAIRAAYQLLERSDPSFAPLWERAIASRWNQVTENAFVDALATAATDGSETAFDFDSGTETGTTLRAALFAASADVETATGMPAEFALVATDVFTKIGGYAGLPDPGYGQGANAEGDASARSLRVEVSGIRIVHCRNLAAGTILVTNPSTASWHEDGPKMATQEQASFLARDMAIYSYGVPAVYLADGIVNLAASYS